MTNIASSAAGASALPDHVYAWALLDVLRDGTAGYLIGRFEIARDDRERLRTAGDSQRFSDERHP
jgi:hypothetical protein